MQDNIPDALTSAFERYYDFPWDESTLRNERLAWRAAWAEATKPCLYQIQEPVAAEQAAWHAGLDEGRAQAAPAAVAVPDGREEFEEWATLEEYEGFERVMRGTGDYHSIRLEQLWQSWTKSRAALAATPAGEQSASPQAQDAGGMYYLQDARWSAMVGNCPSWWRRDGNGYTTNLDEAERFAFEDAMKQHRCRETDLPWLCSEVDKLRRPTVDCQYMPRSWADQRAAIAAQAAQQGGDKQ